MSSEDRSDSDKDLPTTSSSKISNEVGTKSRKRGKYVSQEEGEDDPLPTNMRHIRVT